jgi:predicted nucleic-acid-binding protein
VRITADTNILLRAVLADDEGQQEAALEALKSADSVAVSAHALREFAWVLERSYGAPRREIAEAIRRLMDTGNVVLNRPAVEAGLRQLEAGGDFADGVIAFEGRELGGETFVSFDKRAVKLLRGQGVPTRLLTG